MSEPPQAPGRADGPAEERTDERAAVRMVAAADDIPVTWTRLHPLSPVITFGRTVGLVLVIIGPRVATSSGDLVGLSIEAGILLLGVVAGAISWFVTKWRVAGTELQIETGLIRRQSIRLPLARVQAIDLNRPLLARIFGLAEVDVQVAGSGSGRGRLAYLPEQEAHRIRAQLLAVASGLHADTPPPLGHVLFRVDNRRLVGSTLLGTPMVVLLGLLIASAVVGVLTGSPAVALALLPAMAAVATLVWRKLNAEFNLTVADAPDGLRVDGGLLGTRHETVPLPRVQAVRWVEPLLWRPFGWCRLEIDVAKQRTARRGGDDPGFPDRALLPVGSEADARRVLARVLPDVDPHRARSAKPPRRALAKAPLSYPNLGVWSDDRYVVCASGRLQRMFVVVPLAKVQSLRFVQGPYARRLRLATVHVDLVGRGWRAAAHARDADEAEAMWPLLAERARHARQAFAEPVGSRSAVASEVETSIAPHA